MATPSNSVSESEEQESSNTEGKHSVWIRVLYMLFFVVIFGLVEGLVYLLALASLVMTIARGRPIKRGAEIGASLGLYLERVVCFLTFNTEQAPWPFSDWPKGGTQAESTGESS